MPFAVPAVILGGLAVFSAGYVLTTILLTQIAKYRPAFKPTWQRFETQDGIDLLAVTGGVLAVLLLLILLFILPVQGLILVFIVLIALGFVFAWFLSSSAR